MLLASVTLALPFPLLFAARAAAQVPPLHVQLAPMGLLGVLLASVTLTLLYSRCFFCRKGGCPVYNDHFAGRGAGASCNSARGCYGGRGRVRMLEASLTLSLSLPLTATAAAPLAILFQRDAAAHTLPRRVLGTGVLARPRLFGLACRSAVWRYGCSEA